MSSWKNLSYCNRTKSMQFILEDDTGVAVPITRLSELRGPWTQQSMQDDVDAVVACEAVKLVFLGYGYEFEPVDVYLSSNVIEDLVKTVEINRGASYWD